MRGDNVKLHRLQVTIDLHKSKLYVKTKQKFSKDINSFASKVDKRKIVEVNGECKLYKEIKEKSTKPEVNNVAVSSLWWFVERSERSSQLAESRTNTEDCLHRRSSSFTFFLLHLICLRNSRSGFKARLQAV